MKAKLLQRDRIDFDNGHILELVIWELSQPLPGSAHPYKYRLFYGRPGKRIVGFDNERGKGDHRHLDGEESAYAFTDVETLVKDFFEEVARRRTKS